MRLAFPYPLGLSLRAGAIDAQRRFGSGLQPGRRDFLATAHTFAIAALLDPQQGALHRGDLAGEQRALRLQPGGAVASICMGGVFAGMKGDRPVISLEK